MVPGTIVCFQPNKKLRYAQDNIHNISSKYVYYKNTKHIFKWLYWYIRYRKVRKIIDKHNYTQVNTGLRRRCSWYK